MSNIPRFAVALLLTALCGGVVAGSAGPMVEAPQKSNGAGVSIRYRVEGTPRVGQPSIIRLEFGGVSELGGASARFTSDDELELDAASPSELNLPPGNSAAMLRVTPRAAGRFYVNVFTSQRGARSAISVPVQVGDRPAPRARSQAVDGAAIVMPVE